MTRRAPGAPASALSLLQRELGALVHRLAFLDGAEAPAQGEWRPAADVFEAGEALVVVIEVPGLLPESLRVAFRQGCVVVSGERHPRRNDSAVSFLCLERPNGRFERSIPVEGSLDVAHARATLGRGLLTITVPHQHERRGHERAIHIEREPSE